MDTLTSSGVVAPAADVERITEAAVRLGVPHAQARAAAKNLAAGTCRLVEVSGKIASGKDTVAPMILHLWGITDAVRDYFANALKDEVDLLFADIRFWARQSTLEGGQLSEADRRSLAEFLSHQHAFPVEQAYEFYTGPVATEVLTNPAIHARVRTDLVRYALQKHGTNVRRAQDDRYWVRRTLAPAFGPLAEGTSVYFTDGRFPNEADAVRSVGGVVIRLDITEETQRQRLMSRDGLDINEDALRHESETALDAYPHFDVRVDNDGTVEQTLDAIAARLSARGLL